MYAFVEQKLAAGEVVILDGGTGTDIQRRGVPMDGEVWCAVANRTHPDAVRDTHIAYLKAGADVITANTFASSPLLFNALKRDKEVAELDAIALRLAREAVDQASDGRPVAIAGSFSTMRPVPQGGDRTAKAKEWSYKQAQPLFQAKAEGLAKAGCDLIIMEMMRDVDYSLWATEAAVATGLPVWVGISVERRPDGQLAGFHRHEWSLEDVVSSLMVTGAKACLIMHTSIDNTADALAIAKANWAGPIGAYPESGVFKMPDWQFEHVTPEDFVEHCRRWRRLGASILGGCCGLGPEHIAALSKAFKGFPA
ncbi:MAG: homocysteine S-methyltransferase family protein [Hyphomicrobiales bacterium]